LPVGRLVVAFDDKDLAAGVLRIRLAGGDGGHKGVRSIIDQMESDDFIRVRMGIGSPPQAVTTTEWVLEEVAAAEETLYGSLAQTAAEAVIYLLRRGVTAAMNEYNGKIALEES
ncbi:aminoacyl-tRNA hydrolase, partial [bacterium]|nr:aminoacyl-tRNA hydrolase [candidate division CSSED10-310 bacterium]